MALINTEAMRYVKGNIKVDEYLGLPAANIFGAARHRGDTAEITTDRTTLIVNGCRMKMKHCKTGRPMDEFAVNYSHKEQENDT